MKPEDHLFIILPGIGGSVLERREGARKTVLWEGLRQLPGAVVRAGRLALADDDKIVATGLLDDWRFVGLTAVDGYAHLVQSVAEFAGTDRIDWGDPDNVNLAANVVCVPFDFRRSVETAAENLARTLDDRLKHRGWTEPAGGGEPDADGRPVVIVAHSMGGLVARYWAGPLGGHRSCRAVVTLGTPHRGAPKALEVIANGWRIGPLPISGSLSKVMRDWPGLYELLPRYRAAEAQLDDWAYPKDLVINGLDPDLASDAFAIHKDIERVWSSLGESAPSLTPVIGIGKATLESATVASESKVRSSTNLPDWIFDNDPELATFLGDGTVPRISAIPLELDQDRFRSAQRLVVGGKHGALVNWDGIKTELELLLTGRSTSFVEGDRETEIVVDLPEAWPADTELTANARVYEAEIGSSLVTCTEVSAVQYRWGEEWHSATASGGEWVLDLPGFRTGTETIEVRAVTESGDDPANQSAPLHLLDSGAVEEFGS